MPLLFSSPSFGEPFLPPLCAASDSFESCALPCTRLCRFVAPLTFTRWPSFLAPVVIVTSGWPLLPPLGADGDSFESSTPSFTWRWGMCASWRVCCVCFLTQLVWPPERVGGHGGGWRLQWRSLNFQVRHVCAVLPRVVVIWGVTTHTRPMCGWWLFRVVCTSLRRGMQDVPLEGHRVCLCVRVDATFWPQSGCGLSFARLSPAASIFVPFIWGPLLPPLCVAGGSFEPCAPPCTPRLWVMTPLPMLSPSFGGPSYRTFVRLVALSSRVHCPAPGYAVLWHPHLHTVAIFFGTFGDRDFGVTPLTATLCG